MDRDSPRENPSLLVVRPHVVGRSSVMETILAVGGPGPKKYLRSKRLSLHAISFLDQLIIK